MVEFESHSQLTFCIHIDMFAKNVLNKQLWWHVFIICKMELIVISTLSYQLISFFQPIFCRENDVMSVCKEYHAFF